ncbi:hypothetical protein GJ744_009711 [Endocarpon pusillum]|uniref:Rhodopsin domain-containing protein n=1 Tax=Endocarpon pusillum TaxID=364733 RepID=A0A8H7AY67_9EURO|nr:hypothetical protein GJ744_009711 [Endocarpon pusillum]
MSHPAGLPLSAKNPLEEPALQPPPGVEAHVTNRSDEQNYFYVCITLSTVVPGILLLIRLYTKARLIKKIDLSDYFVTLSFLFFLSMCIVGRWILAGGAAVHMWNLQLKYYIKLNYWMYIFSILYSPAIVFVKLAILLQYLHLLAPQKSVDPFMFITARVMIAIILVYYTISTCVTAFACNPRERIWNPLITEYSCLNNNIAILFTCLFNIFSDLIILALPTKSVWKLQLPLKKKVSIISLFATGLLACIANAVIIIYVLRMSGDHADVTYNTAWAGFWLLAEISLGTVVTCLLSLPKFVEAHGKLFKNTLSIFSRPLLSLTRPGSSERGSLGRSRTKNNFTSEDTTLEEIVGGLNASDAHLIYDPTDRPVWNELPYPPHNFSHPRAKTPTLNGT